MGQIEETVLCLASIHYVLCVKLLCLLFCSLISLNFYLAIYKETPEISIELGYRLEKKEKKKTNLIFQRGKLV